MDLSGAPETKKARWSPNLNGASNANGQRDPFANYGYGSGAAVNQAPSFQSGPVSASPFSTGQLYSQPSLRLNTNQLGGGMGGQLSPNPSSAPPAFAQGATGQQQQSPNLNGNGVNGNAYAAAAAAAGFGGYGMNGMLNMNLQGMNMLNGFPYSPQVGSFPQVSSIFALVNDQTSGKNSHGHDDDV